MPNATITGASRGLGLALARALAADGWRLTIDARTAADLERAARELGRAAEVVALAGDVTDPGPSPQPALATYPLDVLERVYAVNVLAPLALSQLVLPRAAAGAVIINISSDVAVEAYPGWGGYGSSKAALDHVSATLAAERPDLHVYAADPGDLRTRLHQEAFPGEDISDRPLPETAVPGLLALARGEHPSGRYRVPNVAVAPAGVA